MSQNLHATYPDFRRRKLKAFTGQVEIAFKSLTNEMRSKNKSSKKAAQKKKLEDEASSSEKCAIEEINIEEDETSVKGPSMNSRLSSLYSGPKTDNVSNQTDDDCQVIDDEDESPVRNEVSGQSSVPNSLSSTEPLLSDFEKIQAKLKTQSEKLKDICSSIPEVYSLKKSLQNLFRTTAAETCCEGDSRTRVLKGHLGKTAQFWMRYVDRVWNILNFQLATKENNLSLHRGCLEKMVSLFFSYDHQNYARYTAVYLQTVLNLPTTHPGAEKLLEEKGFSVNRSAVPLSRNAVDITIEQTINRQGSLLSTGSSAVGT